MSSGKKQLNEGDGDLSGGERREHERVRNKADKAEGLLAPGWSAHWSRSKRRAYYLCNSTGAAYWRSEELPPGWAEEWIDTERRGGAAFGSGGASPLSPRLSGSPGGRAGRDRRHSFGSGQELGIGRVRGGMAGRVSPHMSGSGGRSPVVSSVRRNSNLWASSPSDRPAAPFRRFLNVRTQRWQTDPPLTTQFISVQRRRSSSSAANSDAKEPAGTNSSSPRKSIDIGNVGVFELTPDDDDDDEEDDEEGDDEDDDKEEEDHVSREAGEIEELFGRDNNNTAKDRANIKAAQCGRPLQLHAQATAAAARIACRAAEAARAAADAACASATDAAADAVSRAVLQEAKRAAAAEQQREHADQFSLRRHQSLHPSARLVDGPAESANMSTAVVDLNSSSAAKIGTDAHETEDGGGNVAKNTERRGSLIQTIVPAAEATMHATVAGWSAYNSTLARVIGRDELAANLADTARSHATTEGAHHHHHGRSEYGCSAK